MCVSHTSLLEVPVCVCQLSQMLINALFPCFTFASFRGWFFHRNMGCRLPKLRKAEERQSPGNIYSTLRRPQVETKVGVAYTYHFLDFLLGKEGMGKTSNWELSWPGSFLISCWVMSEWCLDQCPTKSLIYVYVKSSALFSSELMYPVPWTWCVHQAGSVVFGFQVRYNYAKEH